MALATPTSLYSGGDASTANSIVSGSVSPSANALLVVAAGMRTAALGTVAINTTLSNVGTWTIYSATASNDTSAILAWAKVTGAPGTGTVTVDFGVSGVRHTIIVAEIASGYAVNPVRQTKTGVNALSTLTLTLDQTPLGRSTVIGAVCSRGASNINPGAGFSEVDEDTSGGTGNTQLQLHYDAVNATTSIAWSGLNSTANAAVAMEVLETPAGFFSLMRS